MAEWLGIGLQNRAQQFDSAWYLSSASGFPEALIFLADFFSIAFRAAVYGKRFAGVGNNC